MKSAGFVIMTGFLLACGAAAQQQAGAQAGAQTGAQAGAQTSAQAGKTQAQGSGSTSTGAAASAQNGQTNAALANGSAINAALTAPIDSKKAKPGDAVSAHTTEATKADGKTVIPKGARLVGHVTQATARAKGDSDSSLGIVFDKAILKNGQEVPLNVAVQALATAQTVEGVSAGNELTPMPSTGTSAGGSGRAAGGGALGGVKSTTGGAAGTVTNTAAGAGNTAGGAVNTAARSTTNAAAGGTGAVGGLNAAGQLTSGSHGVFGMQGVNLTSATTGTTQQAAVISSAGKNVHLDSGTQMLLVTQAAATSETPKP